jgi:hypothetical protein
MGQDEQLDGKAMKLIFGDFETYYDKEYSLTNMTPIEYILDARYETICCAIAIDNDAPIFFPRSSVVPFLRNIREPYCFISHNALFDAAILAFKYNIHPTILADTLSMARAVLGYLLKSLRLGDILSYLGLEAKGTTIKDVKGMRFDDIIRNPVLWERFEYYNKRDCAGCRQIYNYLIPYMTAREMRVIDTVIRMVTQPRLMLDRSKLYSYYDQVSQYKQSLLQLGFPKEVYMSNDKFAETLQSFGVDPPRKISNTTGELTWAFAKTDTAFMELQEHPDEMVQKLMEARLGLKTTIEETRTRRFINIAEATINSWGVDHPYLPVPLKYSGAHTHRLSGDWKLNMQNLSARKQKTLREAIVAPKGWKIIAIDAKQIEARLVAWLAREKVLLDAFREDKDIYKEFAADIYYKALTTITMIERFTSKTCILGLGFGMSDLKLLYTLRFLAREAGFDVEYTIEQTARWVNIYRSRFIRIVELWKYGMQILRGMLTGRSDGWKIGPCEVSCDHDETGASHSPSIILPSGLRLHYHNLQLDKEYGNFWYEYSGRWKKIYGAKLIENIVQALDRQHVMDAAMRTETRCYNEGIEAKIVLQLHDENVYCVPIEQGLRLSYIAYEEMCRSPWWGKDFPAAAEIKAGINYADLIEGKIRKMEEVA